MGYFDDEDRIDMNREDPSDFNHKSASSPPAEAEESTEDAKSEDSRNEEAQYDL
jgi:hypothetical protein